MSASRGHGEMPHIPRVPRHSIHSGNIAMQSQSDALRHTALRTQEGGIQRDDFAPAAGEIDG